MRIAIAEDDADQLDLFALWLSGPDRTCKGFATAAAFIAGVQAERFDLLLLDWMLPDGTGGDILSWVRSNLGWEMPVIVVTAREDEATVCTALEAGADDYVVKPPKQRELIARIEAVARRARPGGPKVLRLGSYEVDMQTHRLSMDGTPVTMTQKEFDLATYFFQSPGKLLSRDHLLSKIWGINAEVDTRTVDTHVSRLRKKLALDGSRGWKLVPVYGYGYRFDRIADA
ncbi:MAG: response regulator transcription factor [Burkholderiales bacterium]